jgi:Protein of unknown function (DUF2804)
MGQSERMRIPALRDGAAPRRLPLVRGRRPLKRWRYAGVYGADVMLCAGIVRVGGVPQCFWAVWDRRAGVLCERTRMRLGAVALPEGTVRVRDGDVAIDLALARAGEPVEVVSPHGGGWTWTGKAPVTARGSVVLGASAIDVDAPALVDDSAGYHARATAWDWCAGAGRADDGRALMWNLVAGVHDAPSGSERTVWIDGTPHEVPPVAFTPALDAVGDLRFAAEAQRARHDRVLFGLVESEYRQPFGRFSGTLPDGVALAEGYGVMERHRARW